MGDKFHVSPESLDTASAQLLDLQFGLDSARPTDSWPEVLGFDRRLVESMSTFVNKLSGEIDVAQGMLSRLAQATAGGATAFRSTDRSVVEMFRGR